MESIRKLLNLTIMTVVGDVSSEKRFNALKRCVSNLIDDKTYLDKCYYGLKDYAHFRDQDVGLFSYGTVPRHGHIVFRICKNNRQKQVADSDVQALKFLVLWYSNKDRREGNLLKEAKEVKGIKHLEDNFDKKIRKELTDKEELKELASILELGLKDNPLLNSDEIEEIERLCA